MIFGSRDRGHSPRHTLTEQSIRDRLYGSAVGVTIDTQESISKRCKAREGKAAAGKRPDDEGIKVRKELDLLKRDLERTRHKLDRMRGLNAKKIRLLTLYMAVFLIAGALVVIAVRQSIFTRGTDTGPAAVKPGTAYSIQVAVYGDDADAQRFSSDLDSRGYKAFIRESRFGSGKKKFIVYAGSFKDRKSALETLERLKTKEGMRDSFIASVPQ